MTVIFEMYAKYCGIGSDDGEYLEYPVRSWIGYIVYNGAPSGKVYKCGDGPYFCAHLGVLWYIYMLHVYKCFRLGQLV